MYANIYKQKQITSNLFKSIRKRNTKNTLADNHSVKFDDVRIHYTSLPPSHALVPSFAHHSYKDNPIQLKLKINNLTENSDCEFDIDDLDDIMREVYYCELEKIASESVVREKIAELIQDDKLHLFEYDYELKDYLCEYFSPRSPNATISDESREEIPSDPDLYTGRLSDHPNYHRDIKPQILANIPIRHLRSLLRNNRQTNFDFYICHGQQLYVSDNSSRKAEMDTGYNIVVYQDGTCKITKRDSKQAT